MIPSSSLDNNMITLKGIESKNKIHNDPHYSLQQDLLQIAQIQSNFLKNILNSMKTQYHKLKSACTFFQVFLF